VCFERTYAFFFFSRLTSDTTIVIVWLKTAERFERGASGENQSTAINETKKKTKNRAGGFHDLSMIIHRCIWTESHEYKKTIEA
jgi:hypothetical protein